MTEGTSRQELEQHVTGLAARDPQFRQELVSNPRETMERAFGIAVPKTIDFRVVEETPSHLYLVLPPAPVQPGQELGEAELESVAGGWSAKTECGSCPASQCSCRYTCVGI